MILEGSKTEKIKMALQKTLPPVFHRPALNKLADEIQRKLTCSDSTKYHATRTAKKVPLKWNRQPVFRLMTFQETVDPIELVSGICSTSPNYYISHYPALYWNELSEQRPEAYYLSMEVATRSAVHTGQYDFDLVKQVYMKAPRHTNFSVTFNKTRIYIIEKQGLGKIGVIKKSIVHHGKPLDLRLTDVERTLMDSVISPNYAGGILNLVGAFDKARINLQKLYDVYQAYDPFYPFWQAVGFLLEQTKGKKISSKWRSYFGLPLKDFFLDKKYRVSWLHSKRWGIYYPPGLFHAEH